MVGCPLDRAVELGAAVELRRVASAITPGRGRGGEALVHAPPGSILVEPAREPGPVAEQCFVRDFGDVVVDDHEAAGDERVERGAYVGIVVGADHPERYPATHVDSVLLTGEVEHHAPGRALGRRGECVVAAVGHRRDRRRDATCGAVAVESERARRRAAPRSRAARSTAAAALQGGPRRRQPPPRRAVARRVRPVRRAGPSTTRRNSSEVIGGTNNVFALTSAASVGCSATRSTKSARTHTTSVKCSSSLIATSASQNACRMLARRRTPSTAPPADRPPRRDARRPSRSGSP